MTQATETVEGIVKGERQAYHHGDLRAALMTAALRLIEQHGVKGFTLKDAARMAGVSTAAPYRHFADKEALLLAIQADGFARFNAVLGAGYASADSPREQLLELGVAYLRFALEHPAHIRVMFGLGVKAHPARLESGQSGFALLVRGVKALYPELSEESTNDRVIGCWSVVHGFALLHLDGAFAATFGELEAEKRLRSTLGQLLL